MVRVDGPPFSPGASSWFVITPSISTSGVPFTVATMTTRIRGMDPPPARRKRVCSGELLESEKESSKPLAVSPALVITCTRTSASSTTCGTGTGTAGPIISDSRTGLAIQSPRQPLGEGDAQRAALFLQFLGAHGRVGVGHAPELLGVAQVARG